MKCWPFLANRECLVDGQKLPHQHLGRQLGQSSKSYSHIFVMMALTGSIWSNYPFTLPVDL